MAAKETIPLSEIISRIGGEDEQAAFDSLEGLTKFIFNNGLNLVIFFETLTMK